MRLLVISDIEGLHLAQGSGCADALLSCGDVDDQVILEAAESFGCTSIFAVKGNHDSRIPFPKPIVDLHLRVLEFGGFRFGGLNGALRYKPKGSYLYEQEEVDRFLESFPAVDVFVSHNSPRGVHDRDDGIHVGFDGLSSYVSKARPGLLVHGHQHVGMDSLVGRTRIVGVLGAAMVDFPDL